MNRKTAPTLFIGFVFFIVLIISSFPVSAFDVVTVVGEVNDANQIMSDGEIYEVDDTPQGDDLVKNYIGKRVKVPGTALPTSSSWVPDGCHVHHCTVVAL